jgi:hypothetical protein
MKNAALFKQFEIRNIDSSHPDFTERWTLIQYGEPNINGTQWGYNMRKGDELWHGSIEKIVGENGDPDVLVLRMNWGAGGSSRNLSNVPLSREGAIYIADKRLHREMFVKRGSYKVDDKTRHAGS